ncbi:AAA family ATPase [Candidatus Margulisiibacteriota bacterium]
MIKKVKRIKNLGLVFSDYSWESALPDFKRFNLIYGWTGVGKTTLSNLFAALETGELSKYPSLEYEVESETGNYKHGRPFDKKIRVFNQDYVSKNVGFIDGKANSIFILGEENKKLLETIEVDARALSTKTKNREAASDNLESTNASKAKEFTNVARIISANMSGEATRNYDKRDAEGAFVKLTSKKLLEKPRIDDLSLTLKQLEKPTINELKMRTIKDELSGDERDIADVLSDIYRKGKELALKTVESVVIEKLKSYSDISEWVEIGLTLHEKHKSTKCEYCGQQLQESRVKELAQHFNEADKCLKNDLDELNKQLISIHSHIQNLNAIDKANLYEELQLTYQVSVESFNNEKEEALASIIRLQELLGEKKAKTTDAVVIAETVNIKQFTTMLESLNVEIRKHNQKTNNFKAEKETAQEELEKHYLSTIYDDVKLQEQKIALLEVEIKVLDNGDPSISGDIGLAGLKNRIVENRSRISSPDKACAEINKKLETFLGRNEIVFEVQEAGYSIKRNGEVANHLSDGEKTAIAFVYFVVHLRDHEFDIEKGIVVIDDPISSLDSSSMFQAFAFLKNSVKEAKQIFILTHNFAFLKLLLNWVRHIPNKGHYMIKNSYEKSQRRAFIAELDKELKEYGSEYHYLFKILYEFKSDGTIAQAYRIPNIARKVLDTFLLFRVPSGKGQYKKIQALKPHFDNIKLDAIYKFANDQSHITGVGFDPALVPETQKNVAHLLEMMEAVFPEHYSILVESIK